MLSEWSLWEFIHSRPDVVSQEKNAVNFFLFPDVFIERCLFKRISRYFSSRGGVRFLPAEELSVDWLENNILSPGFFAETESTLFFNAENLTANAKNFILENQLTLLNNQDKQLLFSFTKESPFFKQLAEEKQYNCIQVGPPKFWEGAKLLNFFAHEIGVVLSYDVQNYLIQAMNNTSDDFYNALNLLKLHSEDTKPLSLESVKELVVSTKIDQFDLASRYSQKKMVFFFEKLVERSIDFEEIRSIAAFMQGHLMKIFDPSYMNSKKSLSKYDKEIQSVSKLWTKKEILKSLRFFGELEIEAKSKNTFLFEKLRREYLESCQRGN